jgi:hypothetical protein
LTAGAANSAHEQPWPEYRIRQVSWWQYGKPKWARRADTVQFVRGQIVTEHVTAVVREP